jgi:hypothetical protein
MAFGGRRRSRSNRRGQEARAHRLLGRGRVVATAEGDRGGDPGEEGVDDEFSELGEALARTMNRDRDEDLPEGEDDEPGDAEPDDEQAARDGDDRLQCARLVGVPRAAESDRESDAADQDVEQADGGQSHAGEGAHGGVALGAGGGSGRCGHEGHGTRSEAAADEGPTVAETQVP